MKRVIMGLALSSIMVVARSAELSDSAIAVEIVQKYDKLYKSESSESKIQMDIVTPHYERTLTARVWTKGMERMLVRILEPAKERGVGTLKIENDMWNYLPKTNKVIKIPPSMMMSSWMGSDFTNDDLVREYTLGSDYIVELIHPDTAADSLYYLSAEPKPGRPIIWDKLVFAVRKGDYLPVWRKMYNESGEVVRVFHFRDYKTFDDRTVPSVIELVPRDEDGSRTVLRYLSLDYEVTLKEDIFTLRNLRSPIREN